MGMMKEIATQVEQVCELCPSKYCVGCKIRIKTLDRNIVVDGVTREVEKIENIPQFA